jgi:dolichol-phosphate mannosyltransferase
VEAFRLFPEHARFYSSTIKWLGFERSFILADHGTRHSGRPSYTLRKRIKLAADIILSFSERPLRFAIGFGITMSLSAILMAIWIFWRSVYFEFVDLGVSSILVAIFFVGGSILVVLGILGIYLGRVFNQVKNRPLYIITSKIN